MIANSPVGVTGMDISLGYIDKFISDIDEADDLSAMKNVMTNLVMHCGFEWFTYWLMWRPEGGRASVWITNFPDDYIDYYIQEKFDGNDIIARYSAVVTTPFAWSEVYQKRKLTPAQRVVYNEGALAGIKSGGSVPIHGPGMAKAMFSVANNEFSKKFDLLFAERRHELHLLSTYAHEKIVLLSEKMKAPALDLHLSPREIEITTWFARGKTRWEISKILNIADETVKKLFENACRKLGATNKGHAIAIALMNGLIDPR